MDPTVLNTIRCAEEAVKQLVEECQKQRPLYGKSPKAVAQVSRTGKWLLNAIAVLNRALDDTSASERAS